MDIKPRTHLVKALPILCSFLLLPGLCSAALSVRVEPPKQQAAKTVVKLTLKNTFPGNIESARATVFLNDSNGKVIGQSTKWIIGGSRNAKPLLPNATTNYNFVIQTEKPVTSANVTFSRIVLEGGKLADLKDVIIEK